MELPVETGQIPEVRADKIEVVVGAQMRTEKGKLVAPEPSVLGQNGGPPARCSGNE
jgi:hypothetical protein